MKSNNLERLREEYYTDDNCHCEWCVAHRQTCQAILKDVDEEIKETKEAETVAPDDMELFLHGFYRIKQLLQNTGYSPLGKDVPYPFKSERIQVDADGPQRDSLKSEIGDEHILPNSASDTDGKVETGDTSKGKCICNEHGINFIPCPIHDFKDTSKEKCSVCKEHECNIKVCGCRCHTSKEKEYKKDMWGKSTLLPCENPNCTVHKDCGKEFA